jgi:hypothetical protein
VKLGYFTRRARCGPQSGYVLIVIMLMAALLAIGLAAMDINTRLQLRRDREEEMIHRGAEYARAIRKFQKKFGRFPAKFEDLESTNNVRFIRRKYKDPITNAAWTPLRFGDIRLATGTAMPGAAFGSAPGTPIGASGAQSGSGSAAATPAQRTSTGSSPSSIPFGAAQALGGGAIVGVASNSEDESIRVFDGKNHYKDWQFIAITLPNNALIRGPYVPSQGGILGGAAGVPGAGGIPGAGVPGVPAVPGAGALPGLGGTPSFPGGPALPNIPGFPGAGAVDSSGRPIPAGQPPPPGSFPQGPIDRGGFGGRGPRR